MNEEDENFMSRLFDDRKRIKEAFANWRKEPAFTPKGFFGGGQERLLLGELNTLEMEAMSKVGEVPGDQILSEATAKVDKLRKRGM